jgi:hypothetical protein
MRTSARSSKVDPEAKSVGLDANGTAPRRRPRVRKLGLMERVFEYQTSGTLGITNHHQSRAVLARPRQTNGSSQSPRADLWQVQRGLRHAGSQSRQGAASELGHLIWRDLDLSPQALKDARNSARPLRRIKICWRFFPNSPVSIMGR